MLRLAIECVDMFDEIIREMKAAEALFCIHKDDYRLQCLHNLRKILPTCRGFFRRPYWLRIRSNPIRKNYH